ncbi:MAG TPA: Ig-like domain-containing protein [Candidatus Woesebacteria bacterium]|nr:Ig-like domain-containing protein [Candidatus Woesebacteria bacterium]
MKNKKAWLYLGLAVVILGGVFYYALPKATLVYMTRASRAGAVSDQESYVLGEKLLCQANGEDKCRVNVFLADSNGLAVPDKEVVLRVGEGVQVTAVNKLSDKLGKASFDLTSKTERQYQVAADVEGKRLSRTVTVTFKNQ